MFFFCSLHNISWAMNIFGRMQIRTACVLPDAHHIQQLMRFRQTQINGNRFRIKADLMCCTPTWTSRSI